MKVSSVNVETALSGREFQSERVSGEYRFAEVQVRQGFLCSWWACPLLILVSYNRRSLHCKTACPFMVLYSRVNFLCTYIASVRVIRAGQAFVLRTLEVFLCLFRTKRAALLCTSLANVLLMVLTPDCAGVL
ncbi:hypothetical protein BaRGS_00034999 [Batillaria attramentaria]|uniref:Uncharacterized protein n=1 Tax=Batillaria attramentaria TaxID=370345 RepID=A0ABD0JGN4_9CAEN